VASSHTATLKLAQVAATAKGWRLFLNTIASAWAGRVRREYPSSSGRVVELLGARHITAGLGVGTFDLIGWMPTVITPDMVGQTIARFCAVDAKTGAYKRLSPEQLIFARNVQRAGGFAGVAMRIEETPGRVVISEISEVD
jgi:hypothetical protein